MRNQEEIENHRREDLDNEKTALLNNVNLTIKTVISYIRTSLEIFLQIKTDSASKTLLGKKPVQPSIDAFFTNSSVSINTGYDR